MEAKENSGYTGDRYALDVRQAEAMRRSQRSLRSNASQGSFSKGSSNSGKDKKRVTSQDVELALKGIEQAELQKETGSIATALRIYELSLELLILYLKDEENHKRIPQFDPGAVAARVSCALSDAEELKAQLPQSIVADATESKPAYGSGLVSALSAALLGRPRTTTTASSSTTVNPVPTATKRKTRVQQRVAYPNPSKPISPSSMRRATIKAGNSISQYSQNNHASELRRQDNNTNYNKNASSSAKSQLHQAVLEDLYVPPENVQNTSWEDIAGLADVKQSLQESAILPLVRPDLFTGLRRPQNILLWG